MNRHARIIAALLCVAAICCGPRADAKMSILYSKHNLSVSGPGQIRSLSESRICVFCHTPHNANPLTPLWNKKLEGIDYTFYEPYTSTTMVTPKVLSGPTGPSRLCLSCHDGTIALGAIRQGTISMTVAGGMPPTSPSYFSTSLASHHPISFSYTSARGNLEIVQSVPTDLLFYGASILECTTCHDAHDDTNKKFLRVDSSNSALCTKCHAMYGWFQASHNTALNTWNLSGTNPWPRTGSTSDFKWTTVQQNGCENCHNPHNAEGQKRLLNYQNEENNCYSCHNGNVTIMDIYSLFQKSSRHRVDIYSNIHDPAEALPVTTVHIECVDCHNPHAANPYATPTISGKLEYVSGVNINSGQGTKPPVFASYEYEICFKCHGDTNWPSPTYTPPARVVNSLNLRLAFQTGGMNSSFHPVAGIGNNPVIPSFPSLDAPGMLATSIITCTDCHDSDQSRSIGKGGPRGPHGSIWKPLVRQEYETRDIGTPYQSQYYALCYWCHNESSILNDDSFKKNGQTGLGGHSGHLTSIGGTAVNAPCSVCHDPHGVPDNVPNSGDHAHLINFDTNSVTASAGNSYPLYTSSGIPGVPGGSCTLVCHGVTHDGSAKFSYGGSIQIQWKGRR